MPPLPPLFPILSGVRRSEARAPEVSRARVELLYHQAPMAGVAVAINAAILILASWDTMPRHWLLAWGAAVAATFVWRYWLGLRWGELPGKVTDVFQWEKAYATCVGVGGVLWGAMGSVVFVEATPALQIVITLIFAGLAAGGVVGLGASRLAIYAFVVPLLVPFGVALLVDSRPTSFLMALLVVVYALAMVELGEKTFRHVLGTLNLRNEREQLVRELEQRNAELTSTNETLLDVDMALQHEADARGDYLAVMTHEIRTPLNAVIGLSDLLHEEPDPERRKEMIDSIGSSGRLLLHLVNNLLDISKIDSGELDLEFRPFALAPAIKDVLDVTSLHARKKGVELRSELSDDLPPWLYGDVTRIQQVLMNLINNALKFTEEGYVEVRVHAEQSAELRLVLAVKDTGVGIPSDQQERLFEKYTQVDSSTTRSYGGTGLGLAICRGLVEGMGGKIELVSALGEGACFTVTLPTRVAAEGQQPSPSDSKLDFTSLRVLVVDDNPLNLEVALHYLRKMGVGATGVSGGEAAVQRCCSEEFDVVLMDMMMPDLDGMAAMEMIRKSSRGAPRVVIVTASAMVEERRRCLEAGADGYLSKPLQMGELKRVLNEGPTASTRVDSKVLHHLRLLTGKGEEDFLTRIIGRFEKILEQEMPILRAMVDARDGEQIRRKAHFLKGASQNLGATKLVSLLGELEQLGRTSQLSSVEELMDRIEQEGVAVRAALKKDWLKAAA